MLIKLVTIILMVSTLLMGDAQSKKIVYLVSDIDIPFWQIMSKGITQEAAKNNYDVEVLSADNNSKQELKNLFKSIENGVEGIILSPTSSSACSTLLKFANRSKIPVVIADIGTDEGDYVSYISSDNKKGSYLLGQILGKEFEKRKIENGSVGIIAIPQKRINGQLRTSGFMRAMKEFGIFGAGIKQQVDFSYKETYGFTKELLDKSPDIRAIWLQGSDRYQAALDAIKDLNLQDKVLLLTFDAEPVFLELIPKNIILAAAMQQPYLIGQKAFENLAKHLQGNQVVKNTQLEVLAISKENIQEELPKIKKYVLGLDEE